jgi:adenine/guanine phosphoribosyltransferase-like PRPP-binding protein
MLTPERAKYTVRQVVKMIRARGLEFDAIACRGVSGLLIAPIVAMRLNKALIVVRKSTSDSHSCYLVEGDHGAKRYLILDDFIDSGDTVRATIERIYEANSEARCAGFIAYKRLAFKKYGGANFEKEMNRAWWDQETTNINRFFPAGYVTAVENEEARQCTR